jgi:hypothetical protein
MAGCVRCMVLMGDVCCVYDEVCCCECSVFGVVCGARALCVRGCACEFLWLYVHAGLRSVVCMCMCTCTCTCTHTGDDDDDTTSVTLLLAVGVFVFGACCSCV